MRFVLHGSDLREGAAVDHQRPHEDLDVRTPDFRKRPRWAAQSAMPSAGHRSWGLILPRFSGHPGAGEECLMSVQRRVFPESCKRDAVGMGPQSLETACIAMKSKRGLGKRPEDTNQERIWGYSL